MKRFKLPLALALMAVGAVLIVYFLVAERFDPEKQEAVQQATEKFMRQNSIIRLNYGPDHEGSKILF